jgi:tRNA-specific 2-thiouridylase
MSGGVDSSTVAAMLHHEGYKVIGITLQLYDHGVAINKKGACCAGQDIYDASMVASKLGIAHYVLDYETKFKQSVIDNFIDSYLRGETPLPCVRCNQSVKFADLLGFARDLGAEFLATGHYVRKLQGNNGAELHSAVDASKDQSYFLFSTSKEQLEYLRFPLGDLTKAETRAKAENFGLFVSEKPDSQDICFVPDGNYRKLVNKLAPESNRSGSIMHIDGYKLGDHKGIVGYTIGQRRGLGIAFAEPLYVVKIDPQTSTLYVGPYEALSVTELIIQNVNWLADLSEEYEEVQVKIRSTRPGVNARIKRLDTDSAQISLLTKEYGVSPGQACVVYSGSRVLGGGWITSETKA